MVLADFDQKNLVFVNFGRKNWVLTKKTGFGQSWPTKLVLDDSDPVFPSDRPTTVAVELLNTLTKDKQ